MVWSNYSCVDLLYIMGLWQLWSTFGGVITFIVWICLFFLSSVIIHSTSYPFNSYVRSLGTIKRGNMWQTMFVLVAWIMVNAIPIHRRNCSSVLLRVEATVQCGANTFEKWHGNPSCETFMPSPWKPLSCCWDIRDSRAPNRPRQSLSLLIESLPINAHYSLHEADQ